MAKKGDWVLTHNIILTPQQRAPPGQRQRVIGDVPGNDAAGTDNGAVADAHRGDQRGVRSDEGARANIGMLLKKAVVIAGDGTCAHVRSGTDARVANVSQVVNLGSLFDPGVLDLDEVADMNLRTDRRSRP